MAAVAIITEACIGVKDRACVDVCPVQCIYEFDPTNNVLISEDEAGSEVIATTHAPNAAAIDVFGDSLLYVNLDECTSCTACYHQTSARSARSTPWTAPRRHVDLCKAQPIRSARRARPHVLRPTQPRRLR